MIEEYKDLKEIQMIVFSLGKEEFAVPITSVQEIIMPLSPTHIPKSPSWVEGVINLRGHIIPIIDGKKKFMLDSEKNQVNESRIIVMDVEHEIIGLIVDAVSEVVHLKTEDIEPAPVDMTDDSDFVTGIGKFNNKLLILVDPKKFFSYHEVNDLKKIARVTENINQATKAMEAEIQHTL